jgi:hypothetical protein
MERTSSTVSSLAPEDTLGRRLWAALHRGSQTQLSTLEDVEALLAQGASPSAAKRFGEFRVHEEAHMAAEDALLAHLAAEAPSAQAASELLRAQHRQLGAGMQAVADALCHADPKEAKGAVRRLRDLVARHDEQERLVLLPMLDRTVTDRLVCELLAVKLAST